MDEIKIKKNLPIVQQDSKVMLSKTKSLMSITKKILDNKLVLSDDGWMQRLWDWADANDISDDILARDREGLLASTNLFLRDNNLTELPKEIGNLINLTDLFLGSNLTELPKEIGNLTNLTNLFLGDNLTELPKEIGNLTTLRGLYVFGCDFTELPKEIVNLTNLTELNLSTNPNLILTNTQMKWINDLKSNGCNVDMDDDLFDRKRNLPEIDINQDEIPF